MAVKVKEKVRHSGIEYNIGDVIEKISREEANRLIELGVAEEVESVSKKTKKAEREEAEDDKKTCNK